MRIYRQRSMIIVEIDISSYINGIRKSVAGESRLKYDEMKYACMHGGQKHQSRSTGRRQTSIFKKDCTFAIKPRLSDDGKSLMTSNLSDKHTHQEVDRNTHQYYPRVHKL